MEQMSIQIGLLQRAVSNAPVVAHDVGARLRIPEPKAYGGARDAKEVENFLFDMEQYFLAANMVDEARKVSTATMYLRVMPSCGGAPNMRRSRRIRCDWIPGIFFGRRSECSSSRRMSSTMPCGY
ncbi:UNVERIFIED_CONTAM: hypothetical protein Sradi_5578200 [Sesamum radiatum]|uniref:Uncharacterized protein n=1 Tax=Sesamum radiatum TaxID=300843 RepID=A0AAW2KXF9_SESRA